MTELDGGDTTTQGLRIEIEPGETSRGLCIHDRIWRERPTGHLHGVVKVLFDKEDISVSKLVCESALSFNQ